MILFKYPLFFETAVKAFRWGIFNGEFIPVKYISDKIFKLVS